MTDQMSVAEVKAAFEDNTNAKDDAVTKYPPNEAMS